MPPESPDSAPEAAAPPPPPDGLSERGADLWSRITAGFDLEPAELALLEQAARLEDRIAELEALVAESGLEVSGSAGQPRLHPAVAECRQTRIAVGRLLGQISFPDEDGRQINAASLHGRKAAAGRWRAPSPSQIERARLRHGPTA